MNALITASVVRIFCEALFQTVRVEIFNQSGVEECIAKNSPFILLFWHGSMLYPWWKHRHTDAACLVSQSKDGQILSAMLQRWGYRILRGSSSRGSKEAMAAMRSAVDEGRPLLITPDGPRGPRHRLKMGGVRIAQTESAPLFLFAIEFRRCMRLNSWDRFEIPTPFTKARAAYSEPLFIDVSLDREDLERQRSHIEMMMNELRGSIAFGGT